MQFPIGLLEMLPPVNPQATAPFADAGPPNHGSGETQQKHAGRANTVCQAAGVAKQEILVQVHEPLDEGNGCRVFLLQQAAENNHGAGNAHEQDIQTGSHAQPHR